MNAVGARYPVWESKCSRRGNPSSTAELQQPYKRTGKATERKSRAGPQASKRNSGQTLPENGQDSLFCLIGHFQVTL